MFTLKIEGQVERIVVWDTVSMQCTLANVVGYFMHTENLHTVHYI